MLISSSLKWAAGRGLYVAGAGLMPRMRVEGRGGGFRCRGCKMILREIQVTVRGKLLKMT